MDVARLAKAQASTAWIGAALLLFFGFAYLPEPTGTDLYGKAAWVFYQTLRIGGIATAAAAAFLMSGHVLSLAVDAFVAVVVGLLLIATGVVMFIDGGDMFQSLINVVCGAGFTSSAKRSWSAYQGITRDASFSIPQASNPTPRRVDAPPPLPRVDKGGPTPENAADPFRTSKLELPSSPPPSGYLSALADKRRKDRGEPPS